MGLSAPLISDRRKYNVYIPANGMISIPTNFAFVGESLNIQISAYDPSLPSFGSGNFSFFP